MVEGGAEERRLAACLPLSMLGLLLDTSPPLSQKERERKGEGGNKMKKSPKYKEKKQEYGCKLHKFMPKDIKQY